MTSSDAQKSEVHYATADADGSPTAEGDAADTREMTKNDRHPDAKHRDPASAEHPPRMPSPLTPGTHIVRDDTDVGGPLVVESDDPELSPPHVPIDPFPTERTPEIDPPVER